MTIEISKEILERLVKLGYSCCYYAYESNARIDFEGIYAFLDSIKEKIEKGKTIIT